MKDYDSCIIWLDYFNKNLSRRKGRRVKKEFSIYDPTFSELSEAIKAAGYDPNLDNYNDSSRYPRRPYVKSGYILIPKLSNKKTEIIHNISKNLVELRNKSKRKI